jgi:hypothetical protein
MRRQIHRLALSTVAVLSLGLFGLAGTGCVKQTILSFEDHPRFPVTNLQLFVSKNYYVYKLNEHRFYSCTDGGDKLLCKRACGGSTDIECPSGLMMGYGGGGSNVR